MQKWQQVRVLIYKIIKIEGISIICLPRKYNGTKNTRKTSLTGFEYNNNVFKL